MMNVIMSRNYKERMIPLNNRF